MARRSKRNRPSSPAEILAKNALQRGQKLSQDRSARRNPALWGLPDDLELQPANEDLVVTRDPQRREKLIRARRSDAFSLVSMTTEQQLAADRYVRDWLVRARVRIEGDDYRPAVDNSPGLAPGQHVNQLMIDAGRRVEAVHRLVGRPNARLLEALVEPVAMRGEIFPWRAVVFRHTAEKDRNAQAAAVRMACQSLHEAYPAIDEAEKLLMEERAVKTRRAAEDEAERVRLSSPYAGGGKAG